MVLKNIWGLSGVSKGVSSTTQFWKISVLFLSALGLSVLVLSVQGLSSFSRVRVSQSWFFSLFRLVLSLSVVGIYSAASIWILGFVKLIYFRLCDPLLNSNFSRSFKIWHQQNDIKISIVLLRTHGEHGGPKSKQHWVLNSKQHWAAQLGLRTSVFGLLISDSGFPPSSGANHLLESKRIFFPKNLMTLIFPPKIQCHHFPPKL